jgi:hypothetical protein
MSAISPFSPRRSRVVDSLPHEGGSKLPSSFLPPLWGKVDDGAHRATSDGRGDLSAFATRVLPVALTALSPYRAVMSGLAHVPLPGGRGEGGGGTGLRREQLYCRSPRNPLETNGEAR